MRAAVLCVRTQGPAKAAVPKGATTAVGNPDVFNSNMSAAFSAFGDNDATIVSR